MSNDNAYFREVFQGERIILVDSVLIKLPLFANITSSI